MTYQELRELAKHAARGTAPANFEYENVNAALADALHDLCGSINDFMKNRYDIYNIIIENADEIIPNDVSAAMGTFAEVMQVGQGQKAMFKETTGRQRARRFITQVGLSGVYETARLDARTYGVETKAIGGGMTMDFERFLDGAESLAELISVMTEGLTLAVYGEVQKALIAAISNARRPLANKYSDSKFVASEMQKLITVVKSYGPGAVIFACPEFINEMGPDAIVPTLMNSTSNVAQGIYPADDIDSIHMTGRIHIFRGTPIVEIPQAFIDENNTKTYVNPQYAYIFPTGREKVVKIVLEGQTQMYDFVNRDQSVEVYAYKKVGVAILHHNNWCVYRNTGITNTSEF